MGAVLESLGLEAYVPLMSRKIMSNGKNSTIQSADLIRFDFESAYQ